EGFRALWKRTTCKGTSTPSGSATGRPIADWQARPGRLQRGGNHDRRNHNTHSSNAAPQRMNLPNKLTVSRFILTVAFLAVMFSRVRFHETIALVLFIAGGVTDFLDGQFARRHNLITNFGIL